MPRDQVLIHVDGERATVTLNRPERRNALGLALLTELRDRLTEIAATDATCVVLAAAGPVFSAGHDLGELRGRNRDEVGEMLRVCTDVMLTLHDMAQVVIARVHGLATAAGCQLVAACDLAVAGESAGFALPGGKGGWFCTTPMVEVGRSMPRKIAVELALSGDTIDGRTAERWGLVNRCVSDDRLDAAVEELAARTTRGAISARMAGKPAMYRQLDLPLRDADGVAVEVMADASQHPDAQEMMAAFVEKRPPRWATPASP